MEKVTGTPQHPKPGLVQADGREKLGRAARAGGGPGAARARLHGNGEEAVARQQRPPAGHLTRARRSRDMISIDAILKRCPKVRTF